VALDASTGEVTRSWGTGMFSSPHAVSVDDRGGVGHRGDRGGAADGRPDRRIGHDYGLGLDTCLAVRNELVNLPCTGDPYIFARPTDVVHGDDIYVPDGYRNSRIAEFDAAGGFVGSWGGRGDGADECSIPHGIALRANGDVVVADHRHARVQVFTRDGRHLATHASAAIGRPYDVAMGPDDTLYVLDGGDASDEGDGQHRGYVVTLRHHRPRGPRRCRQRVVDRCAGPKRPFCRLPVLHYDCRVRNRR
jgi:peptidylamidoglycolate lyase